MRTPLSRFLAGDADCLADVLTPFAGDFDAASRSTIEANVPRLGLARKRRIQFRLRLRGAATGGDVAEGSSRLARALGFRDCATTFTGTP